MNGLLRARFGRSVRNVSIPAVWVAFACWLAFAPLSKSFADAPVDVEAVATKYMRARGGIVAQPAWRSFLEQSQAKAWTVPLHEGQCVGFLAFGQGHVRDVDLALYSRGGLALDEDETVAPFAYVRACADTEATAYLRVRMFSGAGELLVLRVDSAPRSLGVLPPELGLAAAPGGRLEPPRDVGPSPRQPGVAERVERAAASLQREGYKPPGATRALRLFQGVAVTSIGLEAGRCYALLAAADRASTLLLEVVGPFESRWLARGHGADARVALCARQTAEHRIRVRSRPRRSVVRLALLEHPAARVTPSDRAGEAEDAARLAEAEVRHGLRTLGMEASALGDVWAEPGVSIATPLRLPAPGCYAVAAVSPAETRVDLRVTDAVGRLVGRDDGRVRSPVNYFCVESPGGFSASIRSASRAQRVTLLLGKEAR